MGGLVAKLEAADAASNTRIDYLSADLVKQEARLDNHGADLQTLALAVGQLPTKEDNQRIEDRVAELKDSVTDKLDGLRDMLIRAPQAWRAMEAQEEQVHRSRRRLIDDGAKG